MKVAIDFASKDVVVHFLMRPRSQGRECRLTDFSEEAKSLSDPFPRVLRPSCNYSLDKP